MAYKSSLKSWIIGVVAGAGTVYLVDGALGSRRRAQIRDKAMHLMHEVRSGAGQIVRDFENRTHGLAAGLSPDFEDVPIDQVLEARVRSELGRRVSNPHSIQVRASAGCVILSGPILKSEELELVTHLKRLKGVKELRNRLESHEMPDISSLQNTGNRTQSFELMLNQWAPAPRFLAGISGAILAFYGFRKSGLSGLGLKAAGAALITRALTNSAFSKMIAIESRKPVNIQKTITINAPADQVFSLWSEYKNFPQFMSHIKKVEDLGNGLSHWVVNGLPGTSTEFTSKITDYNPNHWIKWRTETGSNVQHSGNIRFDPIDGKTRVHLQLSYSPPGGLLGHMLASALHSDPKSQIDDDLGRMKTFIETSTPPHDASQRRK
jgi:uncharacterized membrane protein